MRRHSPYNYAFNNPIYFIDPDGMEAVPATPTTTTNTGGSGSQNMGAVIMGAEEYKGGETAVNIKMVYKAPQEGTSTPSTPESKNLNTGKGDGKDYTHKRSTGVVTEHDDNQKDYDRIVKVKKGVVVRILVDKIVKGILKNGMNFKSQNNLIPILPNTGPDIDDVVAFLGNFTNYLGRELSGYGLGGSIKDKTINSILLWKYERNKPDKAQDFPFDLNQQIPSYLLNSDTPVGRLFAKFHFHTHESNGNPDSHTDYRNDDHSTRKEAARNIPYYVISRDLSKKTKI